MSYQVLQRLLVDTIQENEPIRPMRLVIHSTANPGATDEGHFRWLNEKRQHGWANYYLDWDSISLLVPEGMLAPAQGPTANRDSISFEMCEPDVKLPREEQERLFLEVWKRATWLAANILHRWGWGLSAMADHADISALYPQDTDHTDPIAFLARYGKTWAEFRAEVGILLAQMNGALPKPAEWQQQLMDDFVQTGLISEQRHPLQPVLWWELAAVAERLLARIESARRFEETAE